MKKIVPLGDIHGFNTWQQIVNTEIDADLFIYIGDYFDSFTNDTETQCNNFLDIVEFKKSNPDKVILLIGNHDHHYLPGIGYTGTSGYQKIGKFMIEPLFEQHKDLFQMAFQYNQFLFTHAGVSETFMNDTFGLNGWEIENIADKLNELFIYKPNAFIFNGLNPYGDDICQTPIWIRPQSLIKDSKKIKKAKVVQIVGHTQMMELSIKDKSYFFIDTLVNGEYLVINIKDNKKVEYVVKKLTDNV